MEIRKLALAAKRTLFAALDEICPSATFFSQHPRP